MSEGIGKANEKMVADRYRKQGYRVLNVNKKGFPDLIVLEGSEVKFLVEVKGGKHKVHPFQEEIHKELEEMGLQVKTVRIGQKHSSKKD